MATPSSRNNSTHNRQTTRSTCNTARPKVRAKIRVRTSSIPPAPWSCRLRRRQRRRLRQRASGSGTSTMPSCPMCPSRSSMSSTSGATAMCDTSTRCTTRRPRSTSPAGPCATPTTTTWTSWRRAAWVSWCAPSTVPYQTDPRSTCARRFATRPAGNKRAKPVPTRAVVAAGWRSNLVVDTVATPSLISGGIPATPFSSRPKEFMITYVRTQRIPVFRRGLSGGCPWLENLAMERCPKSRLLRVWSSRSRWV